MARGRPVKKGLDWFKKDVNSYEDFKMMDLMNEFGPVGIAVYDCLLCMIYREGYYLEITPDRLCLAVIRTIGSKWIDSKEAVRRVIAYCAEIGLFDRDLLKKGVLTSAAVQQRYAEINARAKVDMSRYNLLGPEETDAAEKDDSAEENRAETPKTGISAAENDLSAPEIPQEKKRTEKNRGEQSRTEASAEQKAAAAAPSLCDVQRFCKEHGLRVDPERFFNHFEAVGWVVRGNPIVSWQALLRNWEKQERPGTPEPESPPHRPSYDLDRIESYDIFSAMPPGPPM